MSAHAGPSRLPLPSRSPEMGQSSGYRSVSDPLRGGATSPPASSSSTLASFGGSGIPARRESLTSQSTLPSIRSLRTKFGQALGGGSKKLSRTLSAGGSSKPKLVHGSAPPMATSFSTNTASWATPSRVPVPAMSPPQPQPSQFGYNGGPARAGGLGRRTSNPEATAAAQFQSFAAPAQHWAPSHDHRPSVADSLLDAYGGGGSGSSVYSANSPPQPAGPGSPQRSTQPALFPKPTARPFPLPPPSPGNLSARSTSPLPPGRANSPLPPPPPASPPTTPTRKVSNRISTDFARAANSPTLASLRAGDGKITNRQSIIMGRSKSLHRLSSQSAYEKPVWQSASTPALPGTEGGLAPPKRRQRPVSADGRPRGLSPERASLRDDLAFRRHSLASPVLGSEPLKRPSPQPTQPSDSQSLLSQAGTGVGIGRPAGEPSFGSNVTNSSNSVPSSMPSTVSVPSTASIPSSNSGAQLAMSPPRDSAAAWDNFDAIPGPNPRIVTSTGSSPVVTQTVTRRRPISIGASPSPSGSFRGVSPNRQSQPLPLTNDLAVDRSPAAGRQRTTSERSDWSAASSSGTYQPKPRPSSRGTFGEAHSGTDSPVRTSSLGARDGRTPVPPSPSPVTPDQGSSPSKKDKRKSLRTSRSAGERYADKLAGMLAVDTGASLSPGTSGFSHDQIRQASPLDSLVEDLGGRPPSSASEAAASMTSPVKAMFPLPPNRTSSIPRVDQPKPAPIDIPTVALTPARSVENSPDLERTLTLDQMEREIARMEAELALSGTPRASIKAFALDVMSPNFPGAVDPNTDSSSPLPSPISLGERSESIHSATSTSASRNDNITPRTARKWSMMEVEMAYERMKDMLGSTKSLKTDMSGGESEAGDVEGAFERAIKGSAMPSPSPLPRGSLNPVKVKGLDITDSSDREETLLTPPPVKRTRPPSLKEAEDDVLSLLSDDGVLPTVTHTPTSAKTKASPPSLDVASPTQPLKLPVVNVDTPNGRRNHSIASSAEESVELDLPTPATSPPNSALMPKASAESLALPVRTTKSAKRHTLGSAPSPQPAAEDVFSPDRRASDSASESRRRRGSESSSHRPALTSARLVRSRTLDSGRSITATSDAESANDGWATPQTHYSNRRGARSPAQRASSRLSLNAPLRSGAGKDLQKWISGEDPMTSDGGAPPSTVGSIAESRQAQAQASADAAKAFSEQLAERKAKRASATFALKTGHASLAASDSWFPITPDRAAHRRASAKGTAASSVLSSQPGSPVTTGTGATGAFETETSVASLNMASVRSMDKLEIFFKFTAVKAELDKAAVERDALLDALQESRISLSDVRSQRDKFEADLKKERASSREFASALGPDREISKSAWDDMVLLKQTWEKRAKQAEAEAEKAREEIDRLRGEMMDGKAREEQLEQETVMMGARLAAAEAGRPTPSPKILSAEISPRVTSPRGDNSPRVSSPRTRRSTANGAVGGSAVASKSALPRIAGAHRRYGSAPTSPVMNNGMTRSQSQSTATPQSPVPEHSPAPSSPAAQYASAYREREAAAERNARKVSTTSARSVATVDSTTSSVKLDLGMDSSPILSQEPSFAPTPAGKSSWGSNASPLRGKGARVSNQFTRLRLPANVAPPENRVSSYSMTSEGGSDFGDHLPPKEDKGWNPRGSHGPGGLRAADEAFLNDLSTGEEAERSD